MGYARVSAPDRDPGIGAAKRRGVYRGRRKRIDGGRIREPAARQVPKARIARDPGISRMSVYRALRGEDGQGEGAGDAPG